jgi:hypothetical protein
MAKKTDINVSKMVDLAKMDVLAKLRLVVIAIFLLMTLGIILAVFNLFSIGAALLLISYVIVLALMIKLLLSKKL